MHKYTYHKQSAVRENRPAHNLKLITITNKITSRKAQNTKHYDTESIKDNQQRSMGGHRHRAQLHGCVLLAPDGVRHQEPCARVDTVHRLLRLLLVLYP